MLFMVKRGLASSVVMNAAIKQVTVIGSGLMGSGIAQVSAQAQLNVTLVDKEQAILNNAIKSIHSSVSRVAKKKFAENEQEQKAFTKKVLGQITTKTVIPEAVKNADMVVEAIVENVGIKQKLFAVVESAVPPHTILATNTSSLRLADIGQLLKNKKNFGGLHFFNPVPVMKLLEVVRHDETSDETFNSLIDFGKSVGKTTVSCKDTPGFIVNRLLVPYMFEALRMYERGDASMEDIDIAMKLGAGYPMGPFELSDYVGLDTTQFIQRGWHENYPDEPLFRPSKLLDEMVKTKKFGRKSGEGFFKYQ